MSPGEDEKKYIRQCHQGNKFAFQWQALKFFGAGSFQGLSLKGIDVIIDCGANILQNKELLDSSQDTSTVQEDRVIKINWRDGAEPDLTEKDWIVLLEDLERIRLNLGRDSLNVLLCCLEGHGRTGTALSILAAITGVAAINPVKFIRERYCQNAVETRSQYNYIKKITKHSSENEISLPKSDRS